MIGGFAQSVGQWVKEIVIVLLLAGLVEMLMPETELKRFARVAMGLFVVLAVAHPLLAALGGEAFFDTGLASLATWELEDALGGSSDGLDSSLDQGQEMQASSRDRALAAARAGLERQLAEVARREPEVAEARAEVDLIDDPSSPDYGSVEAVRVSVWLRPGATGDEGGEAEGSDGEAGEEPAGQGASSGIEPVRVRVDPVIVGNRSSGAAGTGAAPGSEGSGTAAGDALAGEVAERLRSVLVLLVGVPPGGLLVEVWPG